MNKSPKNRFDITRRNMLRSTLAVSVASALLDRGAFAKRRQPEANISSTERDLIQKENSLLGATDWQLTRVRVINAPGGGLGYRCPWIEGYCSKQSVAAGESIKIMVSTNPPRKFILAIVSGGDHLETIYVAPLDSDYLVEQSIDIDRDVVGETPVTELREKHCHLANLSYHKLGVIARQIADRVRAGKVHPYTEATLIAILTKAIRSRRLTLVELKEDVLKKVKGKFKPDEWITLGGPP